jgi:magnesium chelatase family protein
MVARAYTVAFQGIDARIVEVQCALSAGMPAFSIVGLPDKAVSEARERVRAALGAMAIALPSKRITINLSPADLPKEGSHFDLPIALALLGAIDILPNDVIQSTVALGELSLDGSLIPVIGALPAAMAAAENGRSLLCPAASGAEAAWVGIIPAKPRCRLPHRAKSRKAPASMTCVMSKVRNAPNAPWKSRPRDVIT